MSVFFIQLTVILVGMCQEVERNTTTVGLTCAETIDHSGHRDSCKHVIKQSVPIYHIPSNSEME